MDECKPEERLEYILESLKKEISYEALEKIVEAQEKIHRGRNKNAYDYEGAWHKTCNMNHVGTMTGEALTRSTSASSGVSSEEISQEMTAAERQAAKKRKAEERKEMQLANKIYKPGECMKHMTVELHPALSSAWYGADVSREVAASGARLRVSGALCSPALVLCHRGTPPRLTADSGVLELAPREVKCDRALYVCTADEVAEYVAARDLSPHMDRMRHLTDCHITLVLFGVHDYFKPSGRKKNGQRQQMAEVELEMALTDVLVTAGCDTIKVDTPSELALTIVHFVKAIAEAPYKQSKRQCDEQAQFYMRGDSKNCVPVNKNGAGLSKLWQQMLAILPMSSLERSRALCAKYSSPKYLYEELQTPSGVATIADIGVPRSAVPGSVARRTGGEFARKLAILFTADDGDTLVQ